MGYVEMHWLIFSLRFSSYHYDGAFSHNCTSLGSYNILDIFPSSEAIYGH